MAHDPAPSGPDHPGADGGPCREPAPRGRDVGLPADDATAADGDDAELAALLDHIRRARGFDLSGYKHPTLRRRLHKRLQALKLDSYRDYVDHLQVHPDEYHALFETLLINVTEFFRNAEAWEQLRDEVLPEVLAATSPADPIRVWSAGCSSGEEAYTAAIVLAELLGETAFRERVKIYGTDVDEDALTTARHGVYSLEQLERLPDDLRDRYFVPVTNHVNGLSAGVDPQQLRAFRGDLRRSVIFGRHNVVEDAPISRLDLLMCRNTLMYFNSDVQRRVLERFYFALQPHGVAFLGKAEKLLSQGSMFTPIDARRRFFRKVAAPEEPPIHAPATLRGRHTDLSRGHTRGLRHAAFEAMETGAVVIDHDGFLVLANAAARRDFRLSERDLGRPLRDLSLSYRPVELRGCLERAHHERRTVELIDTAWTVGDDQVFLDVRVIPLRSEDDAELGSLVTFSDVSRRTELAREAETLRSQLQSAYEDLQASSEELETTNEELQSTIEELETTNEELQSTNEELETMNEELQSTNDELQSTNDELYHRSVELDRVNAFLESVLTSLQGGVVVVDHELVIQVWNDRAEDLWGLREDEALGRNLLNLEIGLPVDDVREALRRALSGEADHVALSLPAHNRRGVRITCEVSCAPLRQGDGAITGAIVLMEERPASGEV